MCKISVIIPVYNAEKYIRETLIDVLKQDICDMEILCVDDGSLDRSANIIQLISKEDERIRYFYQENSGPGAARNLGIQSAKGEYIAFLDADDHYPNQQVLSYLYQNAKEQGVSICGGSADRIDKKFQDSFYHFQQNGLIRFEDYQYDFLFWRFIYKTEFLIENQIEFPIRRVYEDPVFMLRAFLMAKEFYVVKECVYLYSGPHHSKNMNDKKLQDYLAGILEGLQLTSENKLKSLHQITLERLEENRIKYIEPYLYSGNKQILNQLLLINKTLDRQLIGLNSDYIISPLYYMWKRRCNYRTLSMVKAEHICQRTCKKIEKNIG
ncbi:conserved hypothetical glycosyl transferase [Lachnospiraceae bacterium TWA4]|nr:conserved hypothetical glycosyl transferase [Lachnospiraceae bacterium TWA4]